MLDLIYLLGAIAFFFLMLGYVRACELLGRRGQQEGTANER